MVKDQKGQAITEFAIVVPLLLVLLFGLIDFGRLGFAYMQLHMVAQESVRLGGLGSSDAEVTQFAKQRYMGDSDELLVMITPNEAARDSGDYVTIELEAPFQAITPIYSQLVPSTFQIETESTIRVE